MLAISRIFGSIRRDERGNALALTAIGLPLLLGSAGLAVDTTQWVLAKRQVQTVADAAAMAGAYASVQGAFVDEAVDRSVALAPKMPAERSVSVETSPTGHAQDPHAVRVTVSVPAAMTFSSLFLRSRPVVSATATASMVENGEFCAFALGSQDDETGIEIVQGSRLEFDCGMATNSSHARAVLSDDSSLLDTATILAFGGIQTGSALRSGHARSHALRQDDPLEDSEPPLIPNTGCPNATVNPDAASRGAGRAVLQPGCYGNMVLNGPVTLEPGEYILNRGNFLVGATGEVRCQSCTIFLTSQDNQTDPGSIGKLKIHPRATVKMSAPKDGPNAGILFYQDRNAAARQKGFENVVSGSSFSRFEGLFYFPSEPLIVDARSGPELECARLVGRRLLLQGRLVIAKDCDADGTVNFAGTEIRLVS